MHKIFPLSVNNIAWQNIIVVHQESEPSKEEYDIFHQAIMKLHKVGGVYAYLDKKGKLLYIGKSKNIYNRVRSHYKEAYKQTVRKRAAVWCEFFNNNTGELTILWKSIKHDRQCIAIEEMIEDVKPSEFNKIYKRGKRILVQPNQRLKLLCKKSIDD